MRLPFTYKIQDLLIRNNFEELETRRIPNLQTQLPKNPTDGQRFFYLAQTVGFNKYWIMEYHDPLKKWIWVGGSPVYVEVDTDQQVAANAANGFVDLATVGPQFTIPFSGDYHVQHGFNFYQAASAANITGQVNVMNNGVGIGDSFAQASSNGGTAMSTMREFPTSCTAGQVLKMMYLRHTVVTMNYRARWMTIRPVTFLP